MIWVIVSVAIACAIPGVVHLVFRRHRARDQLDFNIIDEAIHHLDTEDEPWTVHVEVRLRGPVDPERLRRAVVSATRRHPMARAFQRRWRPWHTVYRWQVVDELGVDPIDVRECASDEDIAAARARFQSTRVPIDSAPPFRMLLVQRPGGDHLMLNFNHAASDGVGSIRFLRSVGRAYGDEPDDGDDASLALRDIAKTSAPSFRQWWQRQLLLNKMLRDALAAPPTRLASHEGSERGGFGFAMTKLDAALTEALVTAKIATGTVNDLLIGVLHRTIGEWNDAHGAPHARVSTMMPVNVRPPDRWTETVSNITFFVSVSTGRDERATVASAVSTIREQTVAIKEQGTAAVLREIMIASPALLVEVKRRLPLLLGLGGERFIDTAVLSNVGRVTDRMTFGELGEATELWFSPPCRMPLGLAIGVAGYRGETFLVFRYRHPQLSEAGAQRFATAYSDALRLALESDRAASRGVRAGERDVLARDASSSCPSPRPTTRTAR